VWGVVRWLAALRWWDVLVEFEARLAPLYLSVTGAAWTLIGIVLLWGLFIGKSWTRLAIPLAVFLWLLEYWIERAFFEIPRANLLFALVASLLLVAVTLASALSRKTRTFLIRSEEHEQPNEYSEPA
jgi:glucose dehydrogenase